jgi:hypothetical protein
MPGSGLSGHPVDQLIRELVETSRGVKPGDVERILERIATAPFDSRVVRVPIDERGVEYGSRRLLPWDDSLFVHLVRRVVLDQEWVMGTSADEYVRDLQRAARVGGVHLAIYTRRGGSIAGILAPTSIVVPAVRLGPGALPELFVVYSADRGVIVSGYQVLSRNELAIPGDAQWLL